MCRTSVAARIAALKPDQDVDWARAGGRMPYARLLELSRQLAASAPGSRRHMVAARRLRRLHAHMAAVVESANRENGGQGGVESEELGGKDVGKESEAHATGSDERSVSVEETGEETAEGRA